jgi:hypothetical protein
MFRSKSVAREIATMKATLMTLTILSLVGGAALAQRVGEPPPNSPFVIWQKQGGSGKPFTPMPMLTQQAHQGEQAPAATAQRGAPGSPATPGTAIP